MTTRITNKIGRKQKNIYILCERSDHSEILKACSCQKEWLAKTLKNSLAMTWLTKSERNGSKIETIAVTEWVCKSDKDTG